jgi:hypothetical protein
MSDGNEEREEQKLRREQTKREEIEDRVYRDDRDEWEPERTDS